MSETLGMRTLVASVFLLAALVAPPPSRAAEAVTGKPPGDRVELGVEERVRSENWENVRDFDESRDDTTHQWRFRTRLWSRFSFGSKLDVALVINNETRNVTEPPSDFRWDEVIIEGLSVDWKPSPRWSLKLGRQDLIRGEGFVLMDGGPLDGSRTAYFNALDVTGRFGKTAVELIGISDPRKDEYLPVLNDRDRLLVEWDEKAVGFYVTDRSFEGTTIEGYLFRKTETGDPRPGTNPQHQNDRALGILGGRLSRDLGHGFSVAAEGAYERGTQDPDVPVRAWGGYAIFRYAFDDAARPTFGLGWIGLSGDDPGTRTIENWDPLFSRWPKWSELYIYSQLSEKGVAYWTNLGMWLAEAKIAPAKPLALRFTYYGMSAFHPYPGDPATFGAGRDRGDLFQVRGDVTLPAGFKGHVLYERLAPGSFYAGDGVAWFFRVEATYTFKKSLRIG